MWPLNQAPTEVKQGAKGAKPPEPPKSKCLFLRIALAALPLLSGPITRLPRVLFTGSGTLSVTNILALQHGLRCARLVFFVSSRGRFGSSPFNFYLCRSPPSRPISVPYIGINSFCLNRALRSRLYLLVNCKLPCSNSRRSLFWLPQPASLPPRSAWLLPIVPSYPLRPPTSPAPPPV